MNPARLRAYTELLVVAIIWGIAGPVIKITLKDIPPDIFLFYRFAIASIVAFFLLTKHKGGRPKDFKIWSITLLYGFLNSTAGLGLLFWGFDKTTLLDSSLISLFGPILMMLLGYFSLHEHLTKRMKLGALVTLVGATMISLEPIMVNGHSQAQELGALFGNFLIFLSLICGAFSGLLSKKLMQEKVSPSFLANSSFIIGLITFTPILLLNHNFSTVIAVIKSANIYNHLGVLYMALVSGSIAYTLNNRAQKTIELSEAAIFSYLYPIFSAILAVMLLGEKVTTFAIVASLITITGVFIAEIKKKRYT